jgi:hypothetical protein
MKCPYGCESPVFTESIKTVSMAPSNLLLEGQTEPVSETVKSYSCNCCGNTFETKEKSDGKIVL